MIYNMDPISINTSKLTRYNTNDSSSEDSLFSRKTSSSSLMSPSLWKSSSTKLNQLCDLKELDLNLNRSQDAATKPCRYDDDTTAEASAINIDALKLALTKIRSNNEETILQPLEGAQVHTTTPQEEINYSKWCIILVGLPAAGKSSLVNQLVSTITKELPHVRADTFNAGNFRRNLTTLHQNADFFDFNNKEAKKQRDLFASLALDHLLNSLVNDSLDIGIFDATNSTVERREGIIKSIEEKEAKLEGCCKIQKLILHVQINDATLLGYNIEGKTTNQDYSDQEHDVAKRDFIKRLDMYRSAFQEITKEELDHYNCMYLGITNAKDVEIYEPHCGETESEEAESEEDQFADNVTIREVDVQATPHQDHDSKDKIDHTDDIYIELVNFARSYYRQFGKAYNDAAYLWKNQSR